MADSRIEVNTPVAFNDHGDVILGWVAAINFDRAQHHYVATVRCPRGDTDDYADVPLRDLRYYP